MLGTKLFLKNINDLDFEAQCNLLKKILKIDVLVFEVNLINDNICIKVYDGYVYYQFVFISSNYDDKYLNINVSDRIIVCHIFVNNINENSKFFDIEFVQFINFLLNGDEKIFNNFL